MKNKKGNKTTLNKLNKVFDFLVNNPHSSFYKDKYKNAGIKFKTIEAFKQFESLPYLTKDEILNEDPYKFLFIPLKSIDVVGYSSGTTNQDKPLALLFSSKSYSRTHQERFQKYYDLNIKAKLLLLPSLSAVLRFFLHHFETNNKVFNVVGDLNNLPLSAKIAKRMRIDAIETTSTALYHFLPYLKKEYDLDKIRLIYLGGEYTSREKHDFIQKHFKNAYIKYSFSALEVGNIGYRCDYLAKLDPRFFHPRENLYFEALNPDSESEMVITSLEKGRWPFLLRYRTGNSVKITEFKCQCGQTTLLELFGRIGHDVLKIQGTSIYPNLINEALTPYSKNLRSLDFRLHVYEVIENNKIKVRLKLQLVTKKNLNNLAEVKTNIIEGVSKNLSLTSQNTLSDLVNKDVFMPLEVEFVDELIFNPKQSLIIPHLV